MVQKTKYIQEMLNKLDNGAQKAVSPDGNTIILRGCEYLGNNITEVIWVYHYEEKILTIAYSKALRYVGKNGRSFEIGVYAYSRTDARIINQVLDRYIGGFVVHSRKGEVIIF